MFLGRPDYKSADYGSAGGWGSHPGFRDSATIFRGGLRPRVAALFDVAAERFRGLSGRNWGPKIGGPGGRTWATLSQIARFRDGRRSADLAGGSGEFGSPATSGPRGVGIFAAPLCSTSLSVVREGAFARDGVRNSVVEPGHPGPRVLERTARISADFGRIGGLPTPPSQVGESGNSAFGISAASRRGFAELMHRVFLRCGPLVCWGPQPEMGFEIRAPSPGVRGRALRAELSGATFSRGCRFRVD